MLYVLEYTYGAEDIYCMLGLQSSGCTGRPDVGVVYPAPYPPQQFKGQGQEPWTYKMEEIWADKYAATPPQNVFW